MSLVKAAEQARIHDKIDYSRLQTLLGDRARPEPKWVADLTGVSLTVAVNSLEKCTRTRHSKRLFGKTLLDPGRTYYAQFPALLELYAVPRIVKPSNIIESGVSSGVSSAHFLMALQKKWKGNIAFYRLTELQFENPRDLRVIFHGVFHAGRIQDGLSHQVLGVDRSCTGQE